MVFLLQGFILSVAYRMLQPICRYKQIITEKRN